MNGKVLGTALGCLAIIAGGLTVHAVALPAPQLTLMGGTGIAPQIETGNLPGGKRAANKAREDKAIADQRAKDANGIMSSQDGKGGQIVPALTPGEIVGQFRSNPEKAAKQLAGANVKVAGIVLKTEVGGGVLEIVLGPANANADSPVFVFRTSDQFQAPQLGQPVELQGFFAFRGKKEGFENEAYFVNLVQEAQPTATPEPTEPPEPFGGWRFVGSVSSSAGGGTAVFVKDGETLYARPGDILEKDVKVVKVEAGEAVLMDHGTKSLVTPW